MPTKNFRVKRLRPLSHFDRRSIRTKRIGKHGKLLRVGCPKGSWDARRKYCRAGMQGLEILMPKRRRRYNPTPCSTQLKKDRKGAIARYFDCMGDEQRLGASAIGSNPGWAKSSLTDEEQCVQNLWDIRDRVRDFDETKCFGKFGLSPKRGLHKVFNRRRHNMPYNYEFGNDLASPEYQEYAYMGFNPELLAVNPGGRRRRRNYGGEESEFPSNIADLRSDILSIPGAREAIREEQRKMKKLCKPWCKRKRRATRSTLKQRKYRKLVKKYGVKRAAKLWRKSRRR